MAKYITTTLPYVNASPHLGHALEFIQADAYVRTLRLQGEKVFFNTGVDEHGTKVWEKANEAGLEPQEYVDKLAVRFEQFAKELNMSYDAFTRTTSKAHQAAAQEFWKRCEASGDIYKASYQVKYCVGCELEKTDSELVDGKCPIHSNLEIQLIEEQNYYFRFSKYQEALLELYKHNPLFVAPEERLGEIRSFVEGGLKDFSISRRKEKLPWGVPVPGDDEQVMYVWFDALVNYISVLGWPGDQTNFEAWWPAIQFAGKDNLRQQSAMWQAMLLSAGLPPSEQVFIHGFITSGGQKMSKSLGNVIDPIALIATYGVDVVRYVLLRHVSPFEDSDLTEENIREAYTGNLVNGLGNLVARIMKLAEEHLDTPVNRPDAHSFSEEYIDGVKRFEFHKALDLIWKRIGELDERITREEPFKVIKIDKEKGKEIIAEMATELYEIGRMLQPFMPATSDTIKATVLANKKPENLFPRLP